MGRRQSIRRFLLTLGVALLGVAFILPTNGVPVPDAVHPYRGLHARGGPPVYITAVEGVETLVCFAGAVAALVVAARLK